MIKIRQSVSRAIATAVTLTAMLASLLVIGAPAASADGCEVKGLICGRVVNTPAEP